jgi:hypothetical protein
MMLKIALAALAVLAATSTANAAAGPGRLQFEVLRNGQPFGTHEFVVTNASGVARVEERARLAAKVGPLTVFRYEHDCTATWSNQALTTLGCSTLKDGKRTRISGERQGENFVVQGGRGARTIDAETPPTIFITLDLLDSGAFIDTETGQVRDVQVTRVGSETIEVAGQPVEAQRYRISSSLTMDLWYDSEGRWVKGAFTARGQNIEYRLASPISAAPK